MRTIVWSTFKQYIEDWRQLLRDSGVAFSDSRFPYTYHHDYIRNKCIRTLPSPSRGDIAFEMQGYKDRCGEEAFAKELVFGALCQLAIEGSDLLNAFSGIDFTASFHELAKQRKEFPEFSMPNNR